jgi:Family of unknown function (DUF5309)
MAPTITREMMTQYQVADGGQIPNDLYIVEVPKMIEFIRRYDHPMLKLVKPGKTHNLEEWRYGEGDLLTKDTTVSGAHTATITTLTVADSSIIQKWQKVRVPATGEIMLVTDPDAGTNQVTVIRDWPAQSGTGTAIDTGSALQLLGPAIPEGADAVDSPIQMGEVFLTYPEIKEYTWKYTHRGRVTPNYEVKSDQFRYQMKKKMKEAAGDLNRDLLSGVANKGDASGSNPSTMGGLRSTTVTRDADISAAALGFDDIMTLAQTIYIDVGQEAMGKTFMGNFFVKRIWNSFFQRSRRTGGMDKSLRLNWDEVETDFGRMKFVINYECDDDELFLWNPQDASLDKYEGGNWTTGLYSTQGWYDRGFLRCDMGSIYEAARRRGRWYGFSVTASDYPDLDVPVPTALVAA